MSNTFYGKYGPGQNSLYEPAPAESVLDFLEIEASHHYGQIEIRRGQHNRDASKREGDKYAAQAAVLRDAMFPNHLAPVHAIEITRTALAARLNAEKGKGHKAAEFEVLLFQQCRSAAPDAFSDGSEIVAYVLAGAAPLDRIAAAVAVIRGRPIPQRGFPAYPGK
jgi:hypothetical protein